MSKTSVTVTIHDVRHVPAGALGPNSSLVIEGTADDNSRVAFKVSGAFVIRVVNEGTVTTELEPHQILQAGAE